MSLKRKLEIIDSKTDGLKEISKKIKINNEIELEVLLEIQKSFKENIKQMDIRIDDCKEKLNDLEEENNKLKDKRDDIEILIENYK